MPLRETLDACLSLQLRGNLPVEQVYADVLRWKGAVFMRQLGGRGLLTVCEGLLESNVYAEETAHAKEESIDGYANCGVPF